MIGLGNAAMLDPCSPFRDLVAYSGPKSRKLRRRIAFGRCRCQSLAAALTIDSTESSSLLRIEVLHRPLLRIAKTIQVLPSRRHLHLTAHIWCLRGRAVLWFHKPLEVLVAGTTRKEHVLVLSWHRAPLVTFKGHPS